MISGRCSIPPRSPSRNEGLCPLTAAGVQWSTYPGAGRIMPPSPISDVHFLISRTCKYVTIYGKGTLQVWLSYRCWDEKITLDFPGRSSAIATILIREARVSGVTGRDVMTDEREIGWCYWRGAEYATLKYAILDYWLFWIKVTWETVQEGYSVPSVSPLKAANESPLWKVPLIYQQGRRHTYYQREKKLRAKSLHK